MHYSCFGLVNTRYLLTRALRGGYAVPGFNFYNMETLHAILRAGEITQSPIILQVSEGALAYMTDDILMGMIAEISNYANLMARGIAPKKLRPAKSFGENESGADDRS